MMTRQVNQMASHFPLAALTQRNGYHWFVVTAVCIGAFMAALDASIVSIALPTIERTFNTSMSAVEWISLIYLLTLAALIIPFGRLSDIIGRRAMYISGFLVFVLGSYLCAISHTLSLLLCFRVLQGIGAALLQANSVSIITAATSRNNRGKALGVQAFAQGIGLSIGPFLGGVLVHIASWNSIFYINVPVGVLGIIVALLILPRTNARAQRMHFDIEGAILLGLALVGIMYLLKEGFRPGSNLYITLALFLFSALMMIWFARVESRQSVPLIDLAYVRRSAIWLGNLSGVLSFSVMYAVTLLGPFWLEHGKHMSSLISGLYLCLVPAGMAVCTPLAGTLADKIRCSYLTVTGMALSCIGCLFLAAAPNTLVPFMIGLFLVGAGLGMFTPPNNARVMSATPTNQLGVAGGILNMSRTIGMGFGVTVGGVTQEIFQQVFGSAHLTLAFRGAFLVAALLALITLLLILLRSDENLNSRKLRQHG